MFESAQPLGTLQRLPSFSGVVMLLALLLSFPWLPVSSPQAPTPADRAAAFYRSAPAEPHIPKTPPNWRFTIHVVDTEEEAAALNQDFPDPMTDMIVVVQPEDELYYLRIRRELNDHRLQRQLPAVRIDDRRPKP